MIEAQILKSREKDMVCLIEYKDTTVKGKKVILYKHGFMGNKITPHRMIVNLSHKLVELGYTVVRFDCIGAGDSEGDCHYTTFKGELEDTMIVVNYVKENICPEKFIILGYSMGGLITSLVSELTATDGIILWSPVSDPYSNFYYLLGENLFMKGINGEDVDFNGDRVGKEFFIGMKDPKYQPLEHIRNYSKPVRIIHGSKDVDVAYMNSIAYKEVLSDVKLHIVDGAGHGYDSIPYQEELFKMTIEYLEEIIK
ncbi:alpha/beta fold hydrolase [uncultured Fusobacterium sp.]|uniref:alpha/beta hydrolase n=1 Tax=uncultured Fusobacterium sp. TaxID=159267 RepID=UPI0025CDB4C4|nr:alpha/beta fold hydrolase [uncultured Fusobacterium sp.]